MRPACLSRDPHHPHARIVACALVVPQELRRGRAHGLTWVDGYLVRFCPHMGLSRYRRGMHDREVVAAIVAGDPAGLAEAYDRYATPLYSFCRTMLREPADAADAV